MINYYNQMAPLGFEPTANNSTWIWTNSHDGQKSNSIFFIMLIGKTGLASLNKVFIIIIIIILHT
jgi:hypothetical protein